MIADHIMARRRLFLVGVFALIVGNAAAQSGQTPAVDREIVSVRGDVYRVREGDQYTILLVTPEGIVLADPLTAESANWLKTELTTRFPQRPVRYVIHTSHRFDRSEGAWTFNETAELVAHRSFEGELQRSHRELPRFLAPFDVNRDGTLERSEWTATRFAALMDHHDGDGNGVVTPAELTRFVRSPERVFDNGRDITLGGKTVRLLHTPFSGEPDATTIVFPDEHVAFVPDAPIVRSGSFSFGRFKPSEAVRWVRAIAAQDVDTIVLASGESQSGSDLRTVRDYLDALVEGVTDGLEVGASLSALQRSAILDAFRTNPYFTDRMTHIADVYHSTRLVTMDWSLAAQVNYASSNRIYCNLYATCSTGGALPVATGALGLAVARFGVSAEGTVGAQTWSSRTSDYYDEEVAFRESRLAVLGSYTTARVGGMSYRLLGGVAFTRGDLRGMSRVKGGIAPYAGRHPIEEQGSRSGFTAGVDLMTRFGSRFGLVVPVRLTSSMSRREMWPGPTDLRIGAGVSMRVLRQLH